MDQRITELIHLFPRNSFGKGILVGIPDLAVIHALDWCVDDLELISVNNFRKLKDRKFDFVLCFFPRPPRREEVENAVLATDSGGVTAIVMPWWPAVLAEIRRCLGVADVYGLSPSIDDIRLVVPFANRTCAAASLALYQPSLAGARRRKTMAYVLARLGFARVWTPYVLAVAPNKGGGGEDSLRTLLRKHFGGGIHLSLFTGTPGYLRKPTMQIMSDTGSILGYCKIAVNTQTRIMLGNEAYILDVLGRLNLGSVLVPDLLLSGSLGEKTAYLVQSTKKWHLSGAPLIPGKQHIDYIVSLFNATKDIDGWRDNRYNQELAGRLEELESHADPEILRILRKALEWSSAIMTANRVPMCLAHRDFTPWNTFAVGRSLYVFDWEFGRLRWPPLIDAYHFVLQKAILVDHKDEDALWKMLFGDSSKEADFLKRCAASLHIVRHVCVPLAVFYLVDMITTYFLHAKHDREHAENNQELLTRWQGLLRRFMSGNNGDALSS